MSLFLQNLYSNQYSLGRRVPTVLRNILLNSESLRKYRLPPTFHLHLDPFFHGTVLAPKGLPTSSITVRPRRHRQSASAKKEYGPLCCVVFPPEFFSRVIPHLHCVAAGITDRPCVKKTGRLRWRRPANFTAVCCYVRIHYLYSNGIVDDLTGTSIALVTA